MRNTIYRSKFNKFRVPYPSVVLGNLGIPTKRQNYKGYWIIKCPFHKGGKERNPSLNLHSIDGHYKCHACGEQVNYLKVRKLMKNGN